MKVVDRVVGVLAGALVVWLLGMAVVHAAEPAYPLDRDACGAFGTIMADVAVAKQQQLVEKFEQLRPEFQRGVAACIEAHDEQTCVGGSKKEFDFIIATMPQAWQMADKLTPFEIGKHFFDECRSHHGAVLPNGVVPSGPQIDS